LHHIKGSDVYRDTLDSPLVPVDIVPAAFYGIYLPIRMAKLAVVFLIPVPGYAPCYPRKVVAIPTG
jgi:hypothetical protein